MRAARALELRPLDDLQVELRATFRRFEILSRDKPGAPVPDVFIRGAGTYTAHINADNPLDTMQSIEHTIRTFDKAAEDEHGQIERLEKTLTDYQAQANRPFDHETRLKELLARQAQLNATLDLDKSDAQATEPAVEPQLAAAAPLSREPAAPKMAQNPPPAPRP